MPGGYAWGVPYQGVSAQGECVCSGGVFPGGLSAKTAMSVQGGCVSAQGRCLPRGIYISRMWTEVMTHACQNITCPQMSSCGR